MENDAGSLAVGDGLLIGILDEDGTVHYFCREEDAKRATGPESTAQALALAGAWADLDWEAMEKELNRIRHERPPSPPISV
jgi:hypothetical protein